jgi:hypothetical protein
VAGEACAKAPASINMKRITNDLPMVPEKGLKLDNNGGPMR